jgi:riboflavin synthase alpha subunit
VAKLGTVAFKTYFIQTQYKQSIKKYHQLGDSVNLHKDFFKNRVFRMNLRLWTPQREKSNLRERAKIRNRLFHRKKKKPTA